MGIRGEISSNRVLLKNRTYFFNVKENRNGDLYVNIVESKNRDAGGFERQSIIIFAEDLDEFLGGLQESMEVFRRAIRDKKKLGRNTPLAAPDGEPERAPRTGFSRTGAAAPRQKSPNRAKPQAERPASRSKPGREDAPPRTAYKPKGSAAGKPKTRDGKSRRVVVTRKRNG